MRAASILAALLALFAGANAQTDICSSGLPVADGVCGGGEIPGIAGVDYPVFAEVPRTNFRCDAIGVPGYYADPASRCQAFYICERQGKGTGFLCPNGTLFNQEVLVCDWWTHVDCNRAVSQYPVNLKVLAEMEAANERLGVNQRERERLAAAGINPNNPINSPFLNSNRGPFGNQGQFPFNQSPFGNQGQSLAPFPLLGQNAPPFVNPNPFAGNNSPFGINGPANSPFAGNSQINSPFGSTSNPFGNRGPFGNQGTTPSPFGSNTVGPLADQGQTNTPFGTSSTPFGSQRPTSSPFGDGNRGPFGIQGTTAIPSEGKGQNNGGPYNPPGAGNIQDPFGNTGTTSGSFGNQGQTVSPFGPASGPFGPTTVPFGNQRPTTFNPFASPSPTPSPFGPNSVLGSQSPNIQLDQQTDFPGGSQPNNPYGNAFNQNNKPTTPAFNNRYPGGNSFTTPSTPFAGPTVPGAFGSTVGPQGDQLGSSPFSGVPPSTPSYNQDDDDRPSGQISDNAPGFANGGQQFPNRGPSSTGFNRPQPGNKNPTGGYQYDRPDREYLPPY